MGQVIEIGIHKKRGDLPFNVNSVDAIKGKGLLSNRHFKEDNNKLAQLTLIEIENINYYNKIIKSNIPAINFRRNIIVKNIRLNGLKDKEFFIGNVRVKGHDLCEPCLYLEKSLKQENLVKNLTNKAGLRCEILTSGKISVGDLIKF